MSFDEEYLDPHGECATEITRLKAENEALRKFYAAWKEIKEYGGRYTMDMAEAEIEIDAAIEKERGNV